MNHPFQPPSEGILISLSDMWQLLLKKKIAIGLGATTMALFALCYVLSRPIQYSFEATFKERGNRDGGMGIANDSIMQYLRMDVANSNMDSQAASMIKSRFLMESVVRQLNLQATLVKQGEELGTMGLIKLNLLVEFAHFKRRSTPLFPDPQPSLCCTNIAYNGEVTLPLGIHFLSDQRYLIRNSEGEKIGEGKLDIPCQVGSLCQFTLTQGPRKEKLQGQRYFLTISSLSAVATALAKSFEIEKDGDDAQLLRIKYHYSDRQLGATIVNEAMKAYQTYLKGESDSKADAQLAYLEKRERDMAELLEKQMKTHANSCSEGITTTGFLDAEKQMEFLGHSHQECQQKLMAIDLELKKLHHLHKEKQIALYDHYSSVDDAEIVNPILSQIRTLKQKQAAISLSLEKQAPSFPPSPTHESLDQEKDTTHHDPLQEFQGIDAATADQLYLSYQNQLDETEAYIRQNNFIAAQIPDPNFDISSLSDVLTDPVSKDIIQQASLQLLHLHDNENRSDKELERIKADLQTKKIFLISHLEQATLIAELREGHIKEKIRALQKIHLDLAQQQISILEKQFADYLKTRTQNLVQQQEVIKNHAADLQKEMAQIPNKWVAEKLFNQQLLGHQKLMEDISRLVESKILSHNLELIQSSPVDLAIPPLLPLNPCIIKFGSLGAFVGASLMSASFLVYFFMVGIPVTPTNVMLQGFFVAGIISRRTHLRKTELLSDNDLETLRRLISYNYETLSTDKVDKVCRGKVWLLAQSGGPDYSYHLATLLSKQGKKVLLLPLFFDTLGLPEEQPGLLTHLQEGIALKINHEEGYDKIAPGGICRYSSELINSSKFKELLAQLRQQYDIILVISPSNPFNAETEALLTIADSTYITLTNERLDKVATLKRRAETLPTTFLFSYD